ncbi:MAG: efflux RND transporter periplasmic adaptor subunit [Gallionella sp.]
MNIVSKLILAVLLLLAVAATGYWFGTRTTSAVKEATSTEKAERKVLYYRNPMGLPDTSPVPRKDSMGMDYVPVYEGDQQSSGVVSINTDKVQKLGVKSEAATMRILDKMLRASGRIEIDEQRTYTIAPKFEGWVQRLYVNTTGQAVSKGQPLFEVYSPELVSGLREQALAQQGIAALKDADEDARDSMRRLAEASATRLKNWDIADGQLNKDHVTYFAPVNGVVLEKKAVQGMRFMPGEVLYQIADLSMLWVIADVPEQEIAAIKVGGTAKVSMEAYPDKDLDGKVDFIYPTLNSATRTVPVRIVIANPHGLIKPAMFAQVELPTGHKDKVLTVPTSAVIDSGSRQVALVQLAPGRFEPREVRLGSRSDRYVEILAGIAEGELVVTSANFLIDAESNLRAALAGFGSHAAQGSTAPLAAGNPFQPPQPLPASPYQGRSQGGTSDSGQPKKKPAAVGHQAQGVLDAFNGDGTVSITHKPIASLGWPGMTMDFELANSSLAKDIPPGSAITFELVERKPDEWVITRIQTATQANAEHKREGR